MRVSIGQKITISFLLVALLVGLLGFLGYSNMKATAKQVEVITQHETPALVKLTEMKSHIQESIEEALAYLLLEDQREKTQFYTTLEHFETAAAEFTGIARIGQPGQEEETELFNQIVTAKEALAIAAGDMFESYERDGTVNLSHIAAFETKIDFLIPLIDKFLEFETEEVAEANRNIEATIANAEWLTIIVVSGAILLATGLGILVSRSISIPINKLRDVAEELGGGNLSVRANVDSRDEIGALANTFNQMAAERQQAEEALRDSEERFRQMAENMREVFFLVDHQNNEVLYINRAYEEVFGRSCESLYEQPSTWLEAIHPEDIGLVNEAFEKQITTGRFDEEFRIIRPDGSIRWIHDSVVPIRDELGQITRLVGIAEDITEHRKAADKIKASLNEKEVLLKEINHRVKNNLQIISSLLNLQSRDIKDERALRSFQVSQDRIKAMALVHEKLYQSEDLARIDFGEYIRSLATDLGSSYGLSSREIALKIDVEGILLGVDIAIPCGIIVNELVANSLKHAFPGNRSGEIAISFREFEGQYTMVIKDDGVGLPDDLDISRSSSLGLTIVNALTGQLGGTIELARNGGSEVSITFHAA